MTSSNRFSVLRETIRNHPVIIASTAATAGVLLGGFFSMQLASGPGPHVSMAAPPAEAKTERPAVKAEKPVPETTGSAPAYERTESSDCERQTWPYLSGDCLDEYRRTHRAARVVSTDKLDKQTVEAIENPTASAELSAPAPWAPAVASTDPLVLASAMPIAAAPESARSGRKGADPVPAMAVVGTTTPAPEAPVAQAPVAQAPVTQTPAVQSAESSKSQAASKSDEKEKAAKNEDKEKQAAKKARRKPKSERRAPAKPEIDDDSDDGSVAAAYSNDRDDEPVATERRGRSRIVRRESERDYEVPAEDGRGHRRVIVIERDRGGMFGNLFGGF